MHFTEFSVRSHAPHLLLYNIRTNVKLYGLSNVFCVIIIIMMIIATAKQSSSSNIVFQICSLRLLSNLKA